MVTINTEKFLFLSDLNPMNLVVAKSEEINKPGIPDYLPTFAWLQSYHIRIALSEIKFVSFSLTNKLFEKNPP